MCSTYSLDLLFQEFHHPMLDKYAHYKRVNPFFTGPGNLHELLDLEKKFLGFGSMNDEDLSCYIRLIPVTRQPRRGDRIVFNQYRHEPVFFWTGEKAVESRRDPPSFFRAGEEFPFNYWGENLLIPIHPDYLAQLQYLPCRVTNVDDKWSIMIFLLTKPFGGSWRGVLCFKDEELVNRSELRMFEKPNPKLQERITCGQYKAFSSTRMLEDSITGLPHADVYVVLE